MNWKIPELLKPVTKRSLIR